MFKGWGVPPFDIYGEVPVCRRSEDILFKGWGVLTLLAKLVVGQLRPRTHHICNDHQAQLGLLPNPFADCSPNLISC